MLPLSVVCALLVVPSLASAARTTPAPLLMECYECRPEDEHCADDVINLDQMKVCVGRACFKSKALKDESESVVRGCWQVQMDEACKKEILAGAEFYTCHCIGDMCNTGAALVPALVPALPLLLALYFA